MATGIGQRRNIAFCGHNDSGKTTLIDQILVASGAVSGLHSVDDGTSICDFDAEERLHHHTIETKVVHANHGEYLLNLLDTPGYPELIGQTIEAFYAADCAAICVHAHAGVEVHARRVFEEAGQEQIGRMIILTRLDGDHIDFPQLLIDLQQAFGSPCALINYPDCVGSEISQVIDVLEPAQGSPISPEHALLRETLVERIVECDDRLMERLFDGQELSASQLRSAAHHAVLQGTLIPVFCTAAKKNVGIAELLEGLIWTAPSPDEIERHGLDAEGHDQIIVQSPDGPLVARVFKNRIDPFVQKLSFIRIYGGSLNRDQNVHSPGSRKDLKLPTLLDVQANQTQSIEHAEAGDIVAVAKMDALHIGTVLGDYQLPEMHFPTPMVGVAVLPKGHSDENKLFNALHKLVEEDPTLRVERDAQTSELVMTGMSELHLNLVRERLHLRDKLEIDVSDPKIPMRETIQGQAEGSFRHKKQSGGRGQFGEVHLRVFSIPRNIDPNTFVTSNRFPHFRSFQHDPQINFLWVDSIVGGSIPTQYLPAIEKGVREKLQSGVLAGCPIYDVGVEVFYGKYHPVDSSEAAFKFAGAMAFRDVYLQASPTLLEPIVSLHVTVPENHVGELYSDLSGRGGHVHGSDATGTGQLTVHAEAPLRSVLHFGRTLIQMTGGQGSFTMEASHYELVPTPLQQTLMQKSKSKELAEALD